MILTSVALLTALSAQPSCVTADRRVESFITTMAQQARGREYCQFRIYDTIDDVDGDGKEDFLVVFSVEDRQGGNSVIQYLGVFASGNNWVPVGTEVGRRGVRLVEKIDVAAGGAIELTTREYVEGKDPMCCPSGKGTVRFRLKGHALVRE